MVRKTDIVPALRFSKERQKFSEHIAGTSRRGGREWREEVPARQRALAKALEWQKVWSREETKLWPAWSAKWEGR